MEKTNKTIKCNICPRSCNLPPETEGYCHVRKNTGEKIELTTYGYNTGLSLDPIEKKPLYHFYPSSSILSFGTIGCIMGCRFCQNYLTSKSKENPKKFNKLFPIDIVKIALQNNIGSIAFTYNDPIAFFEYAIDTARLAQENGLKTVHVTSGYLSREYFETFFKNINAVNIDLKGFSEEFYNKNCFAHLNPVLDTIKYVKNETNVHLELTTLLIEGENNSFDILKREIDWILNNLGELTPLHFSAFFPRYKLLNKPQTSFDTLLKAYNLATSMGLKYVYLGNLSNVKTSSTYCRNCKKPLIVRAGYKIIENVLKDNKCPYCNTLQSGIF